MKLRKLTTEEGAALCACGLHPTEPCHDRACPHYLGGRRTDWQRCGQRAYALALLLAVARRAWASGRRPC